MSPAYANRDSSRAALITIGIFKLIKALLLVIVGVGALKLIHQDVGEALSRWVTALHVDPDNKYFQKVLSKVWAVDSRRLKELGVGTFFYAGIFLTEGLGLVLRKCWAEYFTIIVTGSFIPIELHLIIKHPTAFRAVATLLNILILWYLVAHRLKERKRNTDSAAALQLEGEHQAESTTEAEGSPLSAVLCVSVPL